MRFTRISRSFVAISLLILLAILSACTTGGGSATEKWEHLNEESQAFFCEWKLDQATSLAGQSLELAGREFGPGDEKTADSLHRLAQLNRANGELDVAEGYFLRALSIYETTYPADDPELAQILANIAALYAALGDFEQAEAFAQQSFEITEKAFGPESPENGRNYNTLANIRFLEGRLDEAEQLFKRGLELREPLGDDDEFLDDALEGLANLFEAQGRYEEADVLMERVLAEYEFGGNVYPHGYIGVVDHSAAVKAKLGKMDDAERLLVEALSVAEAHFGKSDPHVADAMQGLAAVYFGRREMEKANALYEKALPICETAYGSDTPQFAEALMRGGQFRLSCGRMDEAIELFNRSIAIKEADPKTDKAVLARSIWTVALSLINKGRYSEALPYLERGFDLRRETLGLEHGDVAEASYLLFAVYRRLGKSIQSRIARERALAIWEEGPVTESLEQAKGLLQLATRHYEAEEYRDAQVILSRAADIYEDRLGPAQEDTLNALGLLALVDLAAGELDRAIKVREQVVERRRENPGEQHADLVKAMEELAEAYQWAGMYEEEEQIYRDELPILILNFGPNHLWVAMTWNEIGSALWNQEKNPEAREAFEKALEMHDRIPEPSEGARAIPVVNLALLNDEEGRLQEAERLYLLGLSIEEAELGEDHEEVAKTLDLISDLYRRTNRENEAADLERRAEGIWAALETE